MLTGIRVVIMGGDARQIEVISKLSELDASVTLVGFDHLQNQYPGVAKADMDEEIFKTSDALILPVMGTDDMGHVESVFCSTDIVLTEHYINLLPKHAKILTGMAKPYLKKLCVKYQIELVELLDRDDVAIYNSIPTAEGAIMMAIQNTDFTIHGATSAVLGFGRTGITMARTLQGMGSKVKVGVRREEHYARAWESGFAPFFIKDLLGHVGDVDLLFNTIPTMIITAQIIANIPHQSLIIDLASKPGGTDFRYAEKRGVKAMLAPGLPGIVAPKTAGQILARALSQLIFEMSAKRRNAQ